MENTSVVSKVLLLLVHLLKLCILTWCFYQHLWALDMHLSTSEVLSFHRNEPSPNPNPQQLEYVFFSFILNCSTKSWQSGNKENNQPKWHASNLFSFFVEKMPVFVFSPKYRDGVKDNIWLNFSLHSIHFILCCVFSFKHIWSPGWACLLELAKTLGFTEEQHSNSCGSALHNQCTPQSSRVWFAQFSFHKRRLLTLYKQSWTLIPSLVSDFSF